jgi:hypothetical protein
MPPFPSVESWFGPSFSLLHPQLQALHRSGGTLRGPVQLSYGRGLAGVVGKRLARRLGIPEAAGTATLEVDIRSDAAGLHWGRRFNQGPAFDSLFQPVGSYPSGYWIERSGQLALQLSVAVRDGGWHWEQTRLAICGVPLPRWLMSRTAASKIFHNGHYDFSVDIRLPVLGSVLAYQGWLDLTPLR